jgi:hypothetical protein
MRMTTKRFQIDPEAIRALEDGELAHVSGGINLPIDTITIGNRGIDVFTRPVIRPRVVRPPVFLPGGVPNIFTLPPILNDGGLTNRWDWF